MNTYILDTHVLLWWLFNDGRLSYNARDIIMNSNNVLFLSTASAWEISTKHRIGKLPEAGSIVEDLPVLLQRARVKPMEITLEDALLAGAFKHEHRDPFDRMIIAQAQLRELPILTKDPAFVGLARKTVW